MIIGSNWEKIPLIKTAKNLGLYVLATDIDPKAEGLNLADEGAIVDPRDLNKLLIIAKKFKPNGITADQCDYSHFASVYLSLNLGLNNAGLYPAQLTTNKLWMREACKKEHILQPRFFEVKNAEEAKLACNLIGFPIIVKPVDNRGSYGVNIVNKILELNDCFLDSLSNSHSRQVIIEAFIEGKHITVDGYCDQKGNHHNLAIASKKNMKGAKPIITDVLYPAEISQEKVEQLFKINSSVVYALKINSGLTHAEYIIDEKGRCFLVEMANRGGGVLTSSIIMKNLYGIDLSKLLIKNSLNENFKTKKINKKVKIILKFLQFKSGKVIKISGLNKLNKLKNLINFKILINVGDYLKSPKSGAERHGFAIIKYKNNKELQKTLKDLKKILRISYEK